MPGPFHLPRPFAAPPQRERARTPGQGVGRPTPTLFIPGVPRRTPVLNRAATPQSVTAIPAKAAVKPDAGRATDPGVAGVTGSDAEEAWLADIAQEPRWTLRTPAGGEPVADVIEAHSPAVDRARQSVAREEADDRERAPGEASPSMGAAQETSSVEPEVRAPSERRAEELESALSWGEDDEPDHSAASSAEIDEASWPYLDYPVDEFGFPILPAGYEALLSGRHGAQPSAGGSESNEGTGLVTTSHPHDPERVARVLQTLAEQIRAGALRLPGEADRGDDAVVLAATLTALLSRNRD